MTRHVNHRSRGFTLLEVLFTLALGATLLSFALPVTESLVEDIRLAAATRQLAERIAHARLDAVRRSAAVALRFEPVGAGYRFRLHVDGNGNGVRTLEITNGLDLTVGAAERLADTHPGIEFGLLPGIPDLDGAQGTTEGVRVGAARILTLSPDGSATSGTLYLRGPRGQRAIRVLGATGRVRTFQYDVGLGQWTTR